MVICAAVGCNTDSTKSRDVSLYRLPKEKHLRDQWLHKLKRQNLPSETNIRVCHLHFEAECFKRDLKHIEDAFIRSEEQADMESATTEGKEETESDIDISIIQKNSASIMTQTIETLETWEKEFVENSTQTENNIEYADNPLDNTFDSQRCFSPTNSWLSSETNKEIDESFDISQQEAPSSEEEAEDDNFETDNSEINAPLALYVLWSSLLALLKRCLVCSSLAKITKICRKGTAVIIHQICEENNHKNIWRSQPLIKGYYVGNITFAASILFSSNTFQKAKRLFDVANIPFISKSSFYRLKNKVLFGVANEAWNQEQNHLINFLKGKINCELSGEGRCDSPGHNAKYLTYSFLDNNQNKIVALTITQCTEAGNSNRMEKFAFENVLQEVLQKNVNVSQKTTDRHIQIKKCMRENYPNISHQFDIWHVSKNIKKKVLAASKKKSCSALGKWCKSIRNHFWWSCGTCNGNDILLREKWMSILFHIQNKHVWTGNVLYHQCLHENITSEKEWLLPDSDAFLALQSIVLDKTLLGNLKHLTNFSHTGNLEVYHSLYNKWLPKHTHFSYQGMIARSQLAAIDYNLGSELRQAKTKSGENRFNLSFSKVTANWSAKPIKERKDRAIFQTLVRRSIDVINNKETLPLPSIPELPKNIASVEKPDKAATLQNQRSRFL